MSVRARPEGQIPGGLMLALGYIAMAGSLSTDLYLPSFPRIVEDLGVSASAVQLTLTAFLIGSAFGQLLIGAISDALGRRRTLIVALVVFAVCGYAAAASPTLEVLIAVRVVQGFSGAAGAVLARAIVVDLASREHAVRAFSTLFVMIALGPAVASPLGAWLTQVGGWRAPLVGLAVIATGMLVITTLVIPESLPPERRHPLTLSTLAHNVGNLTRNRLYLGYALAFGASYGVLMVYISSSSFIVQEVLGMTPLGYGLTFSLTSIFVMLGAWSNGRVAPRLGVTRTLHLAQALSLASAAAFALFALTGALSLAAYLPLVALASFGCGMIMSNASALAVGTAAATAGAGSAVLGFLQFFFGATASPLGGILGTTTAAPAAIAMTGFAVLGLLASALAAYARRREVSTAG